MSSIPIDNILPWTQLIATEGQTVFSTSWTADDDTDVLVYARATATDADDATQLVSPNDYTVAFIGDDETVQVTFLVGRTLDDVITITRATPADRMNLFINTNFQPTMLNGEMGRFVMMIQQNELAAKDLTPHYNTSETLNGDVDTILPILPALHIWRKNTDNTAMEAFDVSNQIITSPTSTADQSIVIWDDVNGDSVDDSNIKIVGDNFEPVTPGTVIGINDTSAFQLPSGTTAEQPGTPGLGMLRYNTDDNDTEVYEDGAWRGILNAGTGAPISATYIVQTASGTLTNEQALADLTTGLLKNTTTTGVLTIAEAGTDYLAPAAIGVTVQAHDDTLDSLSDLGTAADKMAYTTDVDTWAEADITAFARTVLDDADEATARATLGVSIGTDVQAWDAGLDDIAGLAVTDGNIIVGDGTNWVAESGATARTSLGVAIGTDVQAYDATLDSLSDLGTAADKYAYTTGVDTWAEGDITSFARTLLDDADAATMQTTLGLAIGTDVQAWDAGLDDIAGLAVTDGNIIVGDGTNWVAESGSTARTSLGVAIGTDVQAYDAGLQQIADLADPGADRILFWDDSASAYTYLTVGTNLTITDTTLDASGGGGSADSVTKDIEQTAHGLSVNDVVRYSDSGYVKAQADSAENAEVVGVVSAVTDVNNFTLTLNGYVSGLTGLTEGAVMFLSSGTAGLLTGTAPTTNGQVVKPVLIADSTTSGYVKDFRGNVISASSGGSGGVQAWLTFDFQSNVPTILDSFNVSSLTDNGTGDCTINFTTDFANANYAVAGAGRKGTGGECYALSTHTPATGSLRVESGYQTSAGVLAVDDSSVVLGPRSVICSGTQ